MPYQPTSVLRSMAEIRAIVDGIHPTQSAKVLDHIDDFCRVWIERSPFLVMATTDAQGNLDTSPKGDPPGFVKVLDPQTLVIPDRPGNRRYDGFANILQTGRVGLVFFVPNRNEVVRVNGTAQIIRDDNIRDMLAIKGRLPEFAVLVRVTEAFYHCGKAVIRSGLWAPDRAAPTDGLPTYAEAIHGQGRSGMALDEIAQRFAHNDTQRLYDE